MQILADSIVYADIAQLVEYLLCKQSVESSNLSIGSKQTKKGKIMTEIEKNKKLCGKYPFLLPRNVFSDELEEDYDYSYTWIDDMPDSWREKFAEPMLEELKKILIKGDYLSEYRLVQVKEKYGSLRWYANGIPMVIYDEYSKWENKWEAKSSETCFWCGENSVAWTDGWILPICQNCIDERQFPVTYFKKD